jgi:2-polyprenyl-3-methyl-5-hydroxy-6-metoxy-1,4-benzoquinol methylase
MNHKEVTKKSYAAAAREYASNVAALAPIQSIERFITLLPPKAFLLDIGSGSGRDAKIFSERGLNVTGIDFCENLIEIAKATAPLVKFQVMDMDRLSPIFLKHLFYLFSKGFILF